jgi:hypothetical protein
MREKGKIRKRERRCEREKMRERRWRKDGKNFHSL